MALFETKEISGVASAILDMRKPMGSKSDSEFTATPYGNFILEKLGDDDKRLAKKLAGAKPGSGHDNFLKGITVHMDITATHDFVLQYYRYSFRDTVSSSSKMHCIHKGDIKEKCTPFVSNNTINIVNDMIRVYNLPVFEQDLVEEYSFTRWNVDEAPTTKKELFECIIHNTPLGYELTFGEVTNYLQLKTMWNQRKNHKMSSWNTDFVEWVRSLPMSYLITGEE